jgi:acyl carrier protein
VADVFRTVVDMLVDVTGEDAEWAASVTPAARLEDNLRLDSLEVLAFADLLRERFGERVDLPAHLAGLDLDELIALTVGDVVAYVEAAS